MNAISDARWREAQAAERKYWEDEAKDPDKLAADIAEGLHWTAGVLDIRPATVAGRSVLDIAGGPFPLVGRADLSLARRVVLDPLPYPESQTAPKVERIYECAEDYRAEPPFDEVWGYNVLQHVKDPTAVMATARLNAVETIRWFDIIDSPVYPVHPHSLSAKWLREQFGGFRIVRDIEGVRRFTEFYQRFLAIIAVRDS